MGLRQHTFASRFPLSKKSFKGGGGGGIVKVGLRLRLQKSTVGGSPRPKIAHVCKNWQFLLFIGSDFLLEIQFLAIFGQYSFQLYVFWLPSGSTHICLAFSPTKCFKGGYRKGGFAAACIFSTALLQSLRIYPYPLVWPCPRPWSETMVSIHLRAQKTQK